MVILAEKDKTTETAMKALGAAIGGTKDALEKYYNPYFYYSDKNLNFKLFTIDKTGLYIIKTLK